MSRVALITGISGQDGCYLSELLLRNGYDVHGTIQCGGRRCEVSGSVMHYSDLSDASNLGALLTKLQPDEVYNLAAQSHVRLSFDLPIHTADITGVGALRVLEAVRQYRDQTKREIRFYQASSSEMFGQSRSTMQNERTPFYPRSPYACSKVFAYWQTINYREAYDLFAVNGILFNHESPRRGEDFVTRKITLGAARIKLGLQDKLFLGNLDAKRDWGFARDYVRAMWLMLQQDQPDDYVVASGRTHSVRDFLDAVFEHLDLDWHKHVEIDERHFRPTEVDALCGDATHARQKLGWKPELDFRSLACMMADHDLACVRSREVDGPP